MTVLASELQAVEIAHERLGLTYREIAHILRADESTLHRWRAGDHDPSPVFTGRLEALAELLSELRNAFQSAEKERSWLDREVPALGRRPIDLLLEGRIERVTSVLLALNVGIGT